MQRNFYHVEQYFTTLDSVLMLSKPTPETLEVYEQFKQPYLNTIRIIHQLKTYDSTMIEKAVHQYSYQKQNYTIHHSGHQAYESYSQFLTLARTNLKLNALEYYWIADFFNTKYLQKLRQTTHSQFVLAKAKFYEDSLEVANVILKELLHNTENIVPLRSVHDSLLVFQKEIDFRIYDITKYKRLWGRNDPVRYMWNLSFGSSISFKNPLHKIYMAFVDIETGEPELFLIPLISPLQKWSYSITGELMLGSKSYIGFDFTTIRYVYNSTLFPELILFEFPMTYTGSHLYLKYLLRTAVGMRPYIIVGSGTLYYSYPTSRSYVFFSPADSSEPQLRREYLITASKLYSPGLLFATGLDYIPFTTNRIIYSLKWSLYLNLRSHSLIKKFNSILGLNIGFIF